jgi:ADP-L-glycero-D-manno-heptose 6-epimerase
VHLGARTDTTEFNYAIHEALNVEYSKAIWHYATRKNIPLIYASSAATYGSGEHGYEDNHTILDQLEPLNPYGVSKNEFDKWAIEQATCPPAWTGLKFFNVYGPNEAHKGRMASVIFHSFNQIKASGLVKLFRSHRPDFKDGQQLRDFIYVKDLVSVIGWMLHHMYAHQWGKSKNGLYNLGTGKARSFYDLAANTFTAQGLEPNIEFVDMPEDIRDKYQYFTEANMAKLRAAGYDKPFSSLEEGVKDYVANYLVPGKGY